MAPIARRSTTRSSRTPRHLVQPRPAASTSARWRHARRRQRRTGRQRAEWHAAPRQHPQRAHEQGGHPADGDLGHNDPAFSPDGQQDRLHLQQRPGRRTACPRIGIHTCQTRRNCTAGPHEAACGPATPIRRGRRTASWLAVEATRGTGRDIVIIDPRRGDVRVALTDDGDSFAPVVSPDGDQIAYLHRDGVDIDVRVMTLDIAERRQDHPAWRTAR